MTPKQKRQAQFLNEQDMVRPMTAEDIAVILGVWVGSVERVLKGEGVK